MKRGGRLKRVRDWSTAKADQAFSRYIRDRDHVCIFRLSSAARDKRYKDCTNKATQASHYWGRANSATRYDPDNVDGICGGCHMRHEGNKHDLYRDIKLYQLGEGGYKELEQRARSIKKRSEAIKECIDFLKTLL